MGKLGFKDNGNPYLYEEVAGTSSTAIGLDSGDSGKLKVVVSTSPNATPTSVDLKMTIDPTTNGDITFTPDGTGAVVVNNGDMQVLAGNITMPFSNAAGTVGILRVNGNPFITTLGTGNVFVGTNAGNLTLNTLSANFNTALGATTLQSLATGANNIGLGPSCLQALTIGLDNIALGSATLTNLTSGDNNICIGTGAGGSYTTTESDNIAISNAGVLGESNVIRIGTQGAGPGQQNKAFMAGIYGVTPGGGGLNMVTMDNTGQFGSQAISAGGITTLDGDSGSATGATVTIAGGTGISTSAAGSTVTITATGSGSFTWSVITVNQTAVVNNGYICNKAGTLALALPATGAIGDIIRVTGINTATGWQITQAANQQIFFGTSSTTLGATGTLTSSAIRDSIEMVCVVAGASTVWNVISSIGNPTIA